MNKSRRTFAWILTVVAVSTGLTALGQVGAQQSVPEDLRPLLTPRHSEMKFVAARYNADRNMLAGNYAGITNFGGRGGGGQRGAVADYGNPPLVISPNRIARLKRFDMSWQVALGRLENPKLSPEAQADLVALKTTVQKNLAELDTQANALAQVMPLLTFSPALVNLIEARIAIEDIDSEKAAGTLTTVAKQIWDLQTQLSSGTLQASSSQALVAAGAVEQLRTNLAGWNTFYNGYDPIFTWWMELPYKHVDEALR